MDRGPSADERHERAIENGEDGYIDPDTGLFVLTARYLASRPCCGNGCRHCPWQPDAGDAS